MQLQVERNKHESCETLMVTFNGVFTRLDGEINARIHCSTGEETST
jgi:hypothetical protein